MRRRFNNSAVDFAYLYNQLFLDDYCRWIQSVDDTVLDELRDETAAAAEALKRSSIAALDLDFIESEARMLMLSVDAGDYDSDD